MHQELVHLADYLASRKTLTMNFENIETPRVESKPEEYVLTFGKHKGEKLINVYRTDPDDCRWMEESISRNDVLDALRAIKIQEGEI